MSRGLGAKQRLIMKALENNDVVVIEDLLPGLSYYIEKYNEGWLEKACSESEALKRAGRTLAKRGLIEKVKCRRAKSAFNPKWVLAYKRCYTHNNTYIDRGDA